MLFDTILESFISFLYLERQIIVVGKRIVHGTKRVFLERRIKLFAYKGSEM